MPYAHWITFSPLPWSEVIDNNNRTFQLLLLITGVSIGTQKVFPLGNHNRCPELSNQYVIGDCQSLTNLANPTTIQNLKTKITRVICDIHGPLLESVIENLGKRMKHCKQSRGGHLADIHFHICIIAINQTSS